eukprot:10598454-Alexandrium_andersonii.AAC.1
MILSLGLHEGRPRPLSARLPGLRVRAPLTLEVVGEEPGPMGLLGPGRSSSVEGLNLLVVLDGGLSPP